MNLQTTIRGRTENLVLGILEAVRATPLAELRNCTAPSVPGGPGKRSPRKEPEARKSAGPIKRRTKALLLMAAIEQLVFTVARSPAGIRFEDLRASLGLGEVLFWQAAARALVSGLVSSTRGPEGTIFFPGHPGHPAGPG